MNNCLKQQQSTVSVHDLHLDSDVLYLRLPFRSRCTSVRPCRDVFDCASGLARRPWANRSDRWSRLCTISKTGPPHSPGSYRNIWLRRRCLCRVCDLCSQRAHERTVQKTNRLVPNDWLCVQWKLWLIVVSAPSFFNYVVDRGVQYSCSCRWRQEYTIDWRHPRWKRLPSWNATNLSS